MSRSASILTLLTIIATLPAHAQDRPPLAATRDVMVTYRTLGRDAGKQVVMSQSAATHRMRVETAQSPGYAIIDQAGHTTTVVMTDKQMYMEMQGNHGPGQSTGLPDANGRFTRRGTETIAGVRCTLWDYASGDQTGSTCITNDGVTLRAIGKDGGGIEAISVDYSAQPAERFAPPAGFQRMTLPAGMPGGGMPGAGMPSAGMPGAGHGFALPPGVKLPPGVTIPSR